MTPLRSCSSSTMPGLVMSISPDDSNDASSVVAPASPSANESRSPRPFKIIRSMLGLEQCLCESQFPSHSLASPPTQFVELMGIQYIGLGAVVDELTPRERIQDTIEQLLLRTDRIVSIGYVVDDDDDINGNNNNAAMDDDTMSQISSFRNNQQERKKNTETIPLDVWKETYPNDRSMSKPIRKIIDDMSTNNYGSARRELEQELQEQQKRPNRNNGRHLQGITAHNLGVVSVLNGDEDLAVTYFHKAIQLKEAAFGPEHMEVAVSLNELGIQLFAQQQIEAALAAFHRAQTICRHCQHDRRKARLQPMLLNNVACCNFLQGQAMSALVTIQEARDLQQASAKADLDLLHVATTVSNHGYLNLNLKHYDNASAYFEEALLVQQSVLGDDFDVRAIRDTRSNLETANAFHC